jgi:hypothetical protein
MSFINKQSLIGSDDLRDKLLMKMPFIHYAPTGCAPYTLQSIFTASPEPGSVLGLVFSTG